MSCCRRRSIILGTALLVAMSMLAPSEGTRAGGGEAPGAAADLGDIYLFIGEQAAWLGTQIRYTVPETTLVEARFLTVSGEIIILIPLGEQPPGQYTLPWYEDPLASSMVGMYMFEMYFGDEYAVDARIAVLPPYARQQ